MGVIGRVDYNMAAKRGLVKKLGLDRSAGASQAFEKLPGELKEEIRKYFLIHDTFPASGPAIHGICCELAKAHKPTRTIKSVVRLVNGDQREGLVLSDLR